MKAIEVCCGAGGLSLGLKKAGIRVGLAIDNEPEVIKVYRHNIKNPSLLLPENRHAVEGDLSYLLSIVPEALNRDCDLIAGSPPCQDFSSAGLREEGKRAGITLGFAIFVAALRPRWVLMENVPQVESSKSYAMARKVLKRAGYGLTEKIVDASHYGVAQARKRFIMVGRLDEADGFLDSEFVDPTANPYCTTVRDVLGNNVGIHPGGDHPPETRVYFMRGFSRHPGVRTIDQPSPTIIRTSSEPASRHMGMHDKDLVHPRKAPPLTLEQLSAIQGFPKSYDWKVAGTKRRQAQMIANAVPVGLAEAIGRMIKDRDLGKSIPALEDDFVKSLTEDHKLEGRVLRNRKSQINRGRRLLGGRMLADIDVELALLEKSREFTKLSSSVRSDIGFALRLHAEWRNREHAKRQKQLAKERAEAYANDDLEMQTAPVSKFRFKSSKADSDVAPAQTKSQ